ncbi:unnamed protein product [Polarella glacialis]|uniref:Uncharacterized protein n=1 Tax=Polarella glacialis TaxID=89957 RepID=A0A813JIB0_POLGL|nr:unnamed protein product [Polarella glacialis]
MARMVPVQPGAVADGPPGLWPRLSASSQQRRRNMPAPFLAPSSLLSTAPDGNRRNRRASCPDGTASAGATAWHKEAVDQPKAETDRLPHRRVTAPGTGPSSGASPSGTLTLLQQLATGHPEIAFISGRLSELVDHIMAPPQPGLDLQASIDTFMAEHAKLRQVVQPLVRDTVGVGPGHDPAGLVALKLMLCQAMISQAKLTAAALKPPSLQPVQSMPGGIGPIMMPMPMAWPGPSLSICSIMVTNRHESMPNVPIHFAHASLRATSDHRIKQVLPNGMYLVRGTSGRGKADWACPPKARISSCFLVTCLAGPTPACYEEDGAGRAQKSASRAGPGIGLLGGLGRVRRFQGAAASAAAAFAAGTTPPPPEPSAASRRTTQAPPLSCREAPPLPPDEKALSQQPKGSGGRLQILDPITGEEVLPCIWRRQKSVRPVIRDPRTGEEMIFFDPDFKGSLRGVPLDETDEQSLDEALRKTGPSSKATAAASKGPQAVVSQDEGLTPNHVS